MAKQKTLSYASGECFLCADYARRFLEALRFAGFRFAALRFGARFATFFFAFFFAAIVITSLVES